MLLEEHRKNRVGCHRCCQHIFLDLVIRISGTSNHIYVIYSEQKEKRPQSQQHYDCHGSGCQPGTTAEVCPDCRGAGVVRIQRGGGGFAFTSTAPCQRCRGTGKIIHSPCKSCGGAGVTRKKRRIEVNIPAGINEGRRSPSGARATRVRTAVPPAI